MTTPPPRYVSDYQSLIDALRARVDELAITYALIDDLAGYGEHFTSKVLGPSQTKKMGMDNLWLIMGALGIRFRVENDLQQVARMEKRWERRIEKWRRPGNTNVPLSKRNFSRIAREMGRRGGSKPKRFGITEKQLSALQRRKARARWRNPRRALVSGA